MFLILSPDVAEEVVVDAEDACYSVLRYTKTTIICMFYKSRFFWFFCFLNHFLHILTESMVSMLVMITSEMGTVS